MSFLRRLLGGTAKTAPAAEHAPSETSMRVTAVRFDHVRDESTLEVVGEQYYAEAMRDFARVAAEGKAILMRQPDNQYDANAVGVYVWNADGTVSPVGHLTREDAAAFRPLFDAIHPSVIQCEAALAPRRGGGGTDGVVLHLGSPGECIAERWSDLHPLAPDHPWRDKTVTFTGTSVSLGGVPLDRPGQALLARLAGCTVVPRMTKKVHVCVTGTHGEPTANETKAREYGIPVIDEMAFWRTIGIDEAAIRPERGRWAQSSSRW